MAKIDDSVKKKVPELRFKGFTDEWEERKLGDEVRIVMGQSPNSENYTDDPNDYILVQGNADMKNGRVFPRVWTTQITKQAKKDDLILSVRAPVGDIGKTAYDVVIGRGVAAIKGNEFIFQNLGKMKSNGYWTRYSTGSTFESINSTDIKEAIISIPAIEEQNKIGSFFKQLDNTIALHQHKLDLLKEQKKGFLQKMFPKNGEKVPELRFEGFTDDWEERKFADFIDVKSGKDYKHLNSGSIPVYGTGGYMLSVDRALSDIDAIGIGRKGTIDKPYLLKAPFWTVDTLFYAVPKQNIDLQFSLSIFKKINWKKFDESTGVPSLSKTVINSVSVSVPSYEEQQKIGSFFKQLDDTIAIHQRKLDLLKEQKKGFLQKMFV
ncbi:restriction endonuclease subunit S [Lactococcus petauri]|uniref:restriction endonuclease subunit S n=1 Tax=Lactococcus petauri TaxID=1940789 RepID=UPI003853C7F4